jgi:putative transposon-encoded protein
MPISKELREKIFTAIVSVALTSAAFLVRDYIEEKNRQKQYIGELYKQLYDKGAIEVEKINSAYSKIQSLLGKDYALTTYELDAGHTTLREAIESYQKYIRELERFGNSGQIQVAKNLNEWIIELYAEFDLQYKLAEQVQRRIRESLIIENTKSDFFKITNAALDSDIERLIQNENRVYYEAGWFKKPVINGLEQYLNHQFRSAIGLDVTLDMTKALNNLPELSKRKPETEYKESRIPFVFAEGRAFQAPTLEFKGEIDHLKQKDEILKEQVKVKFFSQVIQHDKDIQELLKKRHSSDSRKD